LNLRNFGSVRGPSLTTNACCIARRG
jgi:hypothetical protein